MEPSVRIARARVAHENFTVIDAPRPNFCLFAVVDVVSVCAAAAPASIRCRLGMNYTTAVHNSTTFLIFEKNVDAGRDGLVTFVDYSLSSRDRYTNIVIPTRSSQLPIAWDGRSAG